MTDTTSLTVEKAVKSLPKEENALAAYVLKLQDEADILAGKAKVAEEKAKETITYKAWQDALMASQHAAEIIQAIKDSAAEFMNQEGIDGVTVGDRRVSVTTRPGVEVVDEEALETFLKSKKRYSDFYKMVPKLDKRGLNTFVLGLHNDRQLGDEKETGVKVDYNPSLMIRALNND